MNNKWKMAIELAISAFLFLITILNTIAFAQTQDNLLPPKAQEAINHGLSAAKQQEWELAIKYFKEAQEADPISHYTLFNLAMAYDKASEKTSKYDLLAIIWYRAYLAAASTTNNLQQQNKLVRERIDELEKKVKVNIKKLIQRAKETLATGTNGDDTTIKEELGVWGIVREELVGIVEVQAEVGDIAGAKVTAAEIKDNFWKDYAYKRIAIWQSDAGNITGAKATTAEIKCNEEKAPALTSIARAQSNTGDRIGALQTIAIVKNTAVKMEDGFSKDEVYRDIAEMQIEAGDISEAKAAAAEIGRKEDKISAFIAIAKAQSNTGDRTGAFQTIVIAKNTAAKIEDEISKIVKVQARIAIEQAKAGDVDGAKSVAAKIEDKDQKHQTYKDITEVQAEAGDIAGAKVTAAEIKDVTLKDRAFVSIAEAQAKIGNIVGAKATATEIEHKVDKISALISIAQVQTNTGDRTGALQTIAIAKNIAKMDVFWTDQAYAYRNIADAQAEIGDIAGAKVTTDEVKYDGYDKSYAYIKIANAQNKAGDRTGALQTIAIAKKTTAKAVVSEEETWKDQAYRDIAEIQAEAGDIAGAKATAAEIVECKDKKASAFISIANAQNKMGDKIGALQTIIIAKIAAAEIEYDDRKDQAYRDIAEMQAEMSNIAVTEKGNGIKTQTKSEVKAIELVVDEIFSWARLFSSDPQRPILPDWQAFAVSLKDKQLREVASAIIEIARKMSSAFQDIRVNEAKWQKLRPQANP